MKLNVSILVLIGFLFSAVLISAASVSAQCIFYPTEKECGYYPDCEWCPTTLSCYDSGSACATCGELNSVSCTRAFSVCHWCGGINACFPNERPCTCGNHVVDVGEECDSTPHCDATCKCASGYIPDSANPGYCRAAQVCGNNILEGAEECELFSRFCDSTTCTCVSGYIPDPVSPGYCMPAPVCGNYVLEQGEECEFYAPFCTPECRCSPGYVPDSSSPGYCMATVGCGNGVVEGSEQCDDGNYINGDGCSVDCEREYCGDGHIDAGLGENCDDHNAISGDGCDSQCHTEYCGDMIINNIGETCDDGNHVDRDGCSAECQLEYCGDNLVSPGLGENCDDGNTVSGDGCDSQCHTEYCGDGIVNNIGETCDDGNHVDGDGCSLECQREYCGDHHISLGLGEQCDDGNAISGDGCDSQCHTEYCGDGIVNNIGEQCDDGNLINWDHCDEECQWEYCYPGTYSSDGFRPCQPCAQGTIALEFGHTSCDICPAGTYTPGVERYECYSCPEGTSSDPGTGICGVPVDCVVSDWSDWSGCSAECGGGTQTRERTILTEPLYNGLACPTDLYEAQACNTQICLTDADGDGYYAEIDDCDDANPAIHPGADDSTCNSVDEDCDGTLDEHFVQAATTCGMGVCASTGYLTCYSNPYGYDIRDSCYPSRPTGPDNNCNGLDEDCDGTSDEHYVATSTSCGVGVCAATGQLICANGQTQNTCVPAQPSGADDNCNGVDDDCDGSVDEHYVAASTSCGIGACARTGQLVCLSGVEQDTCTPGLPTAEVCNGIDDNCDGLVDNGLTSPLANKQAGVCTGSLKICGGAAGWLEPNYNLIPGYKSFEIPGNSIDENCDSVKLCDSTATWKNHGEFVSCVSHEAEKLLLQGLITQVEKDKLVSEAAKSAVGQKK